MKKKYRILLFAVWSTLGLTAQPSIQWQKCFGGSSDEYAYSIYQTKDDGYIVAGVARSNDGDVSGNHGLGDDFWILKLNSLGSVQWQKCLGGSGQVEEAHSIKQTIDGGYIVTGITYSNDGDVSGNHGSGDSWVVKLDSIGLLQWQKSLGGSNFDFGLSIQQTTDSGYIMAGFTVSNDGDVSGHHGAVNDDYWIVKLDSAGTIQWQKCLGGSGTEDARSIQQTIDGGYIIAGGADFDDGDVFGVHGSSDYWIVKLNSLGTLLWQKCLGGFGGEEAKSVIQTADGSYIVAGSSNSSAGGDLLWGTHGGMDYWIVKLDTNGNIQWQNNLGGTLDDVAHSIWQTSEGGYIIAGVTSSNDVDVSGLHDTLGFIPSDFWVVKIDSAGAIQWQKCLGGNRSEEAYAIQETSDGGYIVSGFTSSNDGDVSGNNGMTGEFWIVKLDPLTIIQDDKNPLLNLKTLPNPVTEFTKITFALSCAENLSIEAYDIAGRLIKNLFQGELSIGHHEIIWNISDENKIDAGIYFLNFTGKNFSQIEKLVVVK